jgi:hypothetical protein
MTSDASPFHFPVSAGVVAGGGFGIELGALVTGMELSTRTEEVGGHGLGGLVFVVFLLGWAAAFLGASAFLMRWTTGHRVVAIGPGSAESLPRSSPSSMRRHSRRRSSLPDQAHSSWAGSGGPPSP